jgi:hypothetical protein
VKPEFSQSKEASGKAAFTSLCLHLENVPRGHPCPASGLIHDIIPVIKILKNFLGISSWGCRLFSLLFRELLGMLVYSQPHNFVIKVS